MPSGYGVARAAEGAESSADLNNALDTKTEWSDTWRMIVNAFKCGIMAIIWGLNTDITLMGKKVNSADQYAYLGYIMNSKCVVSWTIDSNKNKVRLANYAAYNFLRRSDEDLMLLLGEIWHERTLMQTDTIEIYKATGIINFV
ncbi:hypothetical protein AYI69_g21 [Smittium culicis]|uniref:Uncharacterized protein n=1 Tax=Smittium culicis TaxID=133412 RepID=A0A1R1YU88_9FUNG|nr:hypothetical protein AYI69_g21 [Smittium culicis]